MKLKLVLFLATLTATLSFVSSTVYAVDCTQTNLTSAQLVQCGACSADNQTTCGDNTSKSLDDTIARVINILSVVVGLIAVIMIVVAGFRYITSAAEPARITAAKNTLMYAIIGLIIVALSQVIVRFVLKTATDTSKPGSSTGTGSPGTKPGKVDDNGEGGSGGL